jgi:hypothetical protein
MSGLPLMLKAALPIVPGVNLIPGVAKKGGPLPDLELHRAAVAIDPAQVTAYASVCGFAPSQHLPLTYLHMLSFPLQMEIMTDASFPYPAIGTVHLANSIHRLQHLSVRDTVDVRVKAVDLRPHAKGKVFDLVTTITSAGEPVWESTSTYLRLGRTDPEPAVAAQHEPFEVVPGNGVEWRLAGNLGRRYAAVSGDRNPIHLYPLTAKALGFKRQIAHGMWSKARCVAAIESRLPGEVTVEVEFKKPIFLPGKGAFGSRVVDDGLDFSLTKPGDGAPHLLGRARAV